MRNGLVSIACLAFLSACGSPQDGPVTVRGRVVGHDGRPMRAAWAALQGMGSNRRVPIDSTGSLSFEVETPGCYFLWLVGVHHQSLMRPLFVDGHGRIRFQARLATAPYVDPIDSVRVIGAFNGFSTTEGSLPLHRLPDGTFAGTFAARSDTFAYKLLGVQPNGFPIEGTLADGYFSPLRTMLFSGHAGGFVSFLRGQGDSLRVSFDPAALPRSSGAAVFRFDDPRSHAARIATVSANLDARSERAFNFIQARQAAGEDPGTIRYGWDRDQREVRELIEHEPDPLVRQALLVGYFERLAATEADSLLAQRLFTEVPPTSLAWSLPWGGPHNTVFAATRIANRPILARSYNLRVVDEHPDPEVRADFLFVEVQRAYATVQKERPALAQPEVAEPTAAEMEFSILYGRLQTEFRDSEMAQQAKRLMGPDRAIRPGQQVPHFTVTSLDDSTVTFSSETLRGRVYLVDFWAVWCGPCVVEVPNLEAAYEKYAKDGFTILSISFDPTVHDVQAFRRERSPMPWLHGFARGAFRNETAELFEVAGIPRTILVSETGTILAVDLRGEKLEDTLASILHPLP